MKSLFISSATAAVAISLASSAHANEQLPYVAPEMGAILFAESVLAETPADFLVTADDFASSGADDAINVTASAGDPRPVTEPQNIGADLPNEISDPVRFADFGVSVEDDHGFVSLPQIGLPTAVPSEAALSVDRAPVDPSGSLFTAALANANVVTTQSLTPHYGDIGAFWGDIVAFYGDIDAFWGDISPFYGDIDAFWGDISPFYGDIGAFWGDIDTFYGNIDAFDAAELRHFGDFWVSGQEQISRIENDWSTLERYSGLNSFFVDAFGGRVQASLNTLIDQAEAQFGAEYAARTGGSFRNDLAAEIFDRHGLNINDLQSLRGLDERQRAAFFLDWHDSLNQYSGFDQVDHWMTQVNWTPSITQIQGEGRQAVIGIIDGSFASDADLSDNIAWSGGNAGTVNGHGAAVASLIAGAHDGEGVMGIAPEVQIATYNPFADDGTASWADVEEGINSLMHAYVGRNKTGYVSAVNLSLGQSGWAFSQGLADVLTSPTVARYNNETIYVVASGNDGITQTADIDWDYAKDTTFILVGSVDPSGEISNFSNRPGTTCLLNRGNCEAGNELYRRTVVAPGSLVLVSDGQGGVTRHSGTSFAAPLVSGAITLLHDRWPWLVRKPEETAEIIFRSAQDLGEVGPDEVYGWGLLDVAASQSPLNFNDLEIHLYRKAGSNGKIKMSVEQLLAGGIPSWWDAEGVFFTAFEDLGKTYRDFTIPVSALTYGTSSNVLGHGYQRMQDFVTDRFANWLLSNGKDIDGDGRDGVSQIQSNSTELNGEWSMRFDAIAPQFSDDGAMRPVHNAATLSNPTGTMSFTLGHGQGALALAGNNFGIISDHDQDTGGVNPVLGFASGETFAGATYSPAKATTLSVGYSQQREDWRDLDGVSDIERNLQRQLGAREAEALTIGVEQKIAKGFSVNAQYTYLREDDAVLGAQTGNALLLGEGARTNAFTISTSMDLGDGFSFDLSATGGATQTAGGQLLATSNDVVSTAGQFTLNKRGVVGSRDILRVSVGQPLTIERGELELTSEQVVDRITGERGVVTQTIGIDTKRRYTGEVVYATPVSKTSELGVVGRYISAGEIGQDESFMIGANFGLRF